jgi:hypothetical protein
MKRFIKSILQFIPLGIIFYVILLIIWGDIIPVKYNRNIKYVKGAKGYLYTRVHEITKYKNVDILFLGSSLSYRGFDVRQYQNLGLKVFNLGSSGQTPVQTEILLDRYLSILNPKKVIYAVPSFVSDGVESSLDLIANDKKDKFTLDMMLEINNLKTYNTGIYGFYRALFNRDKNFSEPLKNDEFTYVPGGFVESKISYYSPNDDKYNKSKMINKKAIPYQKENFERIIEKLKNRNIEIVLINAPITKKHYIYNSKRDAYMRSKAEYYDFNLILDLNDSLSFSDPLHLNQNGVELFNKKIIKILNLKKHAKTPSHNT